MGNFYEEGAAVPSGDNVVHSVNFGQTRHAEAEYGSHADNTPYRVLLIEDNKLEVALVRERLANARRGFTLTAATSAASAETLWQSQAFDCAVLDLQFPGVSGLEIISQLQRARPDMAIVVYSGMDDEDLRRQAFDLGAFDFICKNGPEADALDRGILYALERARAARIHRQFEGLVAANPDAMIVTDNDGRVLYVNRAASRLFGRSIADFRGERMGFAIHEGVSSELDLFCNGERRAGEMRVVYCSWDGKPALLAAIRDVTQQRNLAAQLQEAQRMELAGQFASGAAHDFGNVLSSIGLFAEAARQGLEADDPRFKHLEQILRGVQQGRSLVAQLMTFAGSRGGTPAIIDVRDVLHSAEPMIRRTLPETISLQIVSDSPLAPVLIDPMHLEQVLLNLLINARDATPAGGRVIISCSNEQDGRGKFVRIRVRDNGKGIEPEHLPKVLQPFFTTKGSGRGTGLGLAMCQTIVSQAGGEIRVASKLGEGSTFDINLPVALDAAMKASPAENGKIS